MHTNPRRGLARRFAAGLLAAALGLGGSLAQAATTLNLSYNGAADSEKNLVHLFASNLKRLAEEKSGGELQFKLYPNSMLGEEEQRMEQVMTGPGLNIASFAGIAPLFPEIYVSATPFMFKDAAAAHAFFDSGSYWQAAREAFRERTGTELLAVVEEGGFSTSPTARSRSTARRTSRACASAPWIPAKWRSTKPSAPPARRSPGPSCTWACAPASPTAR